MQKLAIYLSFPHFKNLNQFGCIGIDKCFRQTKLLIQVCLANKFCNVFGLYLSFSRPKLVMVILGNDGENTEVVCRDLSDLEDYYQPYSPGKL